MAQFLILGEVFRILGEVFRPQSCGRCGNKRNSPGHRSMLAGAMTYGDRGSRTLGPCPSGRATQRLAQMCRKLAKIRHSPIIHEVQVRAVLVLAARVALVAGAVPFFGNGRSRSAYSSDCTCLSYGQCCCVDSAHLRADAPGRILGEPEFPFRPSAAEARAALPVPMTPGPARR